MQNLLCVLFQRGQQTVVPQGSRVQLCAGTQHQTLPDLSLLAQLGRGVYRFSCAVVNRRFMTNFAAFKEASGA